MTPMNRYKEEQHCCHLSPETCYSKHSVPFPRSVPPRMSEKEPRYFIRIFLEQMSCSRLCYPRAHSCSFPTEGDARSRSKVRKVLLHDVLIPLRCGFPNQIHGSRTKSSFCYGFLRGTVWNKLFPRLGSIHGTRVSQSLSNLWLGDITVSGARLDIGMKYPSSVLSPPSYAPEAVGGERCGGEAPGELDRHQKQVTTPYRWQLSKQTTLGETNKQGRSARPDSSDRSDAHIQTRRIAKGFEGTNNNQRHPATRSDS